jgi:hypothetical protein
VTHPGLPVTTHYRLLRFPGLPSLVPGITLPVSVLLLVDFVAILPLALALVHGIVVLVVFVIFVEPAPGSLVNLGGVPVPSALALVLLFLVLAILRIDINAGGILVVAGLLASVWNGWLAEGWALGGLLVVVKLEVIAGFEVSLQIIAGQAR